MVVRPIPAFNDNYIWMLVGAGKDRAVVIDPGDERPVLAVLQAERLDLEAILVTHKHGDHVGGVLALKRAFPAARVFGPAGEPVPGLDRGLREGDEVTPQGIGVCLQVMDVPGHTEGHIAFYGQGMLFCGDTLFAGGCGRVFSGTHQQLYDSLSRIAGLPADTMVYCAHEYTLDNLGFCSWVEPDNPEVEKRTRDTQSMRRTNQPSVPSLLGLELKTNPFLRTDVPEVARAAERYAGRRLESGADVFTAIRTWKDREYD